MELAVASGQTLRKGDELYLRVDEALKKVREENNGVVAQINDLRSVRKEHVTEESRLYSLMQGGDVREHGELFIEQLRKIQEVDGDIAKMRFIQFQNSRDISELKRKKNRIERLGQLADVMAKLEEVSEDDDEQSHAVLKEALKTQEDLQSEFDANKTEVVATRKEIESALGTMRNLELALLVRRGKHDAEVETFRGDLVTAFFTAQRKNMKLTRLREWQGFLLKDIGNLEQAIGKIQRRERVKEVIARGDRTILEMEFRQMVENVEKLQAVADNLETNCEQAADDTIESIEKLRDPSLIDSVNVETGRLREKLIKALRKEELGSKRLRQIRETQAQYIILMGKLKDALGN